MVSIPRSVSATGHWSPPATSTGQQRADSRTASSVRTSIVLTHNTPCAWCTLPHTRNGMETACVRPWQYGQVFVAVFHELNIAPHNWIRNTKCMRGSVLEFWSVLILCCCSFLFVTKKKPVFRKTSITVSDGNSCNSYKKKIIMGN